MLFLLYGPDTFRSSVALQEIIQSFQDSRNSGMFPKTLDARELSVEEILQELFGVSMFQERKLLAIRHAFQEKPCREFLLSHKKLLRETPHTILLFEEGEVSANDTLFQFVATNGKVQKFDLLSGASLNHWIIQEGERYGLNLSKEAGRELSSSRGGDLWALSQEMRKLAAFKKSESSKQVTLEDVKALSSESSFETDIFATIDAIAQQNKARALELLHKHLMNGDSPLYLLSMIHFQFRNILRVKDSKGGSVAMHPFVVKKSREMAVLFTLEQLKAIYETMWNIDIAVKTGRMEGEAALDAFLLGCQNLGQR